MSGLYENPPHLIPDQTTRDRHATSMTRRNWRQVVIIYTLLVCSPLFFAYGNFRAHGGDAFSAVVRSVQGESGRGWSALSCTVWEETVRSSKSSTYAELNLLLVYGEMPGERLYPPPNPPSYYHRYRTTVQQSCSTLYVDVDTHLTEPDFDRLYPKLVEHIVNQFTTPPRVALGEALRTRMELLPYVVHNVVLSFLDFLSIRDACILATVLGAPGLPILALLVLVPFWLALPVFWLWVVLSIVYVVLPPRAWGRMRAMVGRSRHRA
ncbi:MAG: hypothetical protein ABFD13_06445 [Candidatus Cryosericum sp.]|nr:hypothetical protein [bacterium]